MIENLIIYQKTYESLKYAYVALKQFPKSEKFSLASDIRESYYKLIRLIIEANRKTKKLTDLYALDTELVFLKSIVHLSFEMKFIDVKKYEVLSKQLVEIGKILGGWIKSSKV
jgi:four helix bundle protein